MTFDKDLIELLGILAAGAVAWGTQRNELKNLKASHVGLATELRPKVTELTEKVATRKEEHAVLLTKVDGLKEQLDRIEGGINRRPQPQARSRSSTRSRS